MLAGWLNSFRPVSNHNIRNNIYSRIFIQTRDYAARKGTREKAKKKKIQINLEKARREAQKITKKEKVKATTSPLLAIDDRSLKTTTDDVWVMKLHPQPVYSIQQAIECHRETHHPTMLNKPNAFVNAFIELNMKYKNRNKYIDKFSNTINLPYPFDSGTQVNTLLALSKDIQQQDNALKAGANYAGGVQIIKEIQAGKFDYKQYDYIIAHIDILTELLLIRGLLKRKFPNVKTGNLGNDLGTLVTKFRTAIKYLAIPDGNHKEYAQINVSFGKLDMDVTHLEENFASIVKNVEAVGVEQTGSFIKRVRIKSEMTEELLKVDFNNYLKKKVEAEPEEEPDGSAVIETL